MKSDRQGIPGLIACPYLYVEMQNSQFHHNEAASLRPIHSAAVCDAESKSHSVVESKKAKMVCSCFKFLISSFPYIGIQIQL